MDKSDHVLSKLVRATAGTPAAVEFCSVRKRYGRHEIFRDLSFSVGQGRFFALVGDNGAGKTTCIKSLLDFVGIDSGRIAVFGASHRETSAREPLAFVPERFLPPYYLTGWDFLRYAASLSGDSFDRAAAVAMCARLDFALEALGRPAREFSKGMGQKLGLCASFLRRKPLLVLDEPMDGLDPRARLLVKNHLKSLRDNGTTIFFSTHTLSDVEELCDEIGILHRGQLRFLGSLPQCREMFREPTIEAAFLRCIDEHDANLAD